MSNRGRRWHPVRPRRNSFLLYALGSIGTFAMASRAVHWFDGPPWLGLAFAAIGLVLAGYYLVRALLDWRRSAAGRR
jgi:uncharacterized membrane protein YfcA